MRTRAMTCVIGLAAAFALVAPAADASIAQSSVVSDNPANFTPNILDGGGVTKSKAYAVEQIGSTMYVGGQFALVQPQGGTEVTRNNIVAFGGPSAGSPGALTSFAPNISGPVWGIEAANNALYVGGQFTKVNGENRRAIVKLDPTTGAVDTAFNARFKSGKITEVRYVNGRLLVAGSIPGKLVALDPATGANTGYINLNIAGSVATNAGPTNVDKFAVNPAGTRLVGLGNFTSVDGKTREHAFMLNLDAGGAVLSDWYYAALVNECRATSIPQQLRDVDFSPDGSYFVFVASGYIPRSGGEDRDICDATARFETAVLNPTRPTWINYTGGDSLFSVAATGDQIYVQGHQRWVEATPVSNDGGDGVGTLLDRPGIAALSSSNGAALAWNPTKTRGIGGKDMFATSEGLWVASDGRRFHKEVRDNIAFCPLP